MSLQTSVNSKNTWQTLCPWCPPRPHEHHVYERPYSSQNDVKHLPSTTVKHNFTCFCVNFYDGAVKFRNMMVLHSGISSGLKLRGLLSKNVLHIVVRAIAVNSPVWGALWLGGQALSLHHAQIWLINCPWPRATPWNPYMRQTLPIDRLSLKITLWPFQKLSWNIGCS